MGDWADGKAREWLEAASPAVVMEIRERWMAVNLPSLAALLREVREQPPDQFGACDPCHGQNISVLLCPKCDGKVCGLAEVRRVVEEQCAGLPLGVVKRACDEILARLEKL